MQPACISSPAEHLCGGRLPTCLNDASLPFHLFTPLLQQNFNLMSLQYEEGAGEQIPLGRGEDGGPGEPAEGGALPG